jgi:hypothetical protein
VPREAHNAPLHVFAASPDLVKFGSSAYRRRSKETSTLLAQLLERLREEGFAMPYTMEEFKRDYFKEHFVQLRPQEQEEVLRSLPPEKRLAGLSPGARLAGLTEEQVGRLLDQLATARASPSREPRRRR